MGTSFISLWRPKGTVPLARMVPKPAFEAQKPGAAQYQTGIMWLCCALTGAFWHFALGPVSRILSPQRGVLTCIEKVDDGGPGLSA